ncbi:MAG: hypothetical protein FWE71_09155 [Nocardioidaceae bacterium]|nr:hypothetical protein [Nocardioidaceae bacterium]MCL2614570.1 hypothetical protein [Nocardioidaceae bacterium]
MSLNLYDVLDVDESASTDEIRTAWKAAIGDLDPTDRRFRAYNDAAGVLLDAGKRASYDEDLARERADADPTEAPEATAQTASTAPSAEPADEPADSEVDSGADSGADAEDATEDASARRPDEPDEPGEPVDEERGSEPETRAYDEHTSAPEAARSSRGPGVWTLAVAGLAAVVAVVLAVWTLTLPNVRPGAEQSAQITSVDATVEQLVSDKIVPAMSYDYRSLPQNLKQLQTYMSPSMAGKEANAWGALSKQAKAQHAVVDSEAPYTGLTRVSDDGSRAVVVAFIDQHVRKLATAPFTLKMWATFVLAKDANTGDWHVTDICTDRVCG